MYPGKKLHGPCLKLCVRDLAEGEKTGQLSVRPPQETSRETSPFLRKPENGTPHREMEAIGKVG